MTRDDALTKIRTLPDFMPGTTYSAPAMLILFERAGLIKFDEPRDTLKHKLVGCTVTFISRHRDDVALGSLDLNGAGIILNRIEALGFKIVEASK